MEQIIYKKSQINNQPKISLNFNYHQWEEQKIEKKRSHTKLGEG